MKKPYLKIVAIVYSFLVLLFGVFLVPCQYIVGESSFGPIKFRPIWMLNEIENATNVNISYVFSFEVAIYLILIITMICIGLIYLIKLCKKD